MGLRLSELFWKGILTGNFRKWGKREWDSYRLLFEPHQRIGIEVETSKWLEDPTRLDKVLSSLDSERALRTHGKEYQVLFNPFTMGTETPQRLHAQVRNFSEQARKHSLPTTGSIHINLQIEECANDLYLEHAKGGGYTNFSGENYGKKARYEIKCGCGCLNYEDLLIQFVAAAWYFRHDLPMPEPCWYPLSPRKRAFRVRNYFLTNCGKKTADVWYTKYKALAEQHATVCNPST